ncbi:DNA-binding transcriptional regulator, AcrR family [Brevibacterium siliguriense]|uniref:DNA-binding transcriptional regulator, AcrR family n=1 Tax=Brevibacterium siliguriense TaxID=1136497 RepID=A0A1H1N5F5_9MICO|nr:TetR family transcriptional regulator [Brevibacterium siliguriense]SDR94194.1 DNA-binding transcriptional regulator, AcrR family [Brevibacterium siliguriense]
MANVKPGPRGRGRPRKESGSDARAAITDAASAEFAEKGYDKASIRGIARRAQVDSALVHHYFESKAGLFAEVVKLPVRPDRIIRSALDVSVDRLGESLVHTVLSAWEQTSVKSIGVTVLRSAVSDSAAGRLIRQFLLRELKGAVAGRIANGGVDRAEADLRATLVLTQMAGALMFRHVLELEPLASMPIDDLTARLTPAVQGHLDGVGDSM